MDREIFSKLWLYMGKPVYQGLQGLGELSREEQCLLQLVLPVEEQAMELSNRTFGFQNLGSKFCISKARKKTSIIFLI